MALDGIVLKFSGETVQSLLAAKHEDYKKKLAFYLKRRDELNEVATAPGEDSLVRDKTQDINVSIHRLRSIVDLYTFYLKHLDTTEEFHVSPHNSDSMRLLGVQARLYDLS